MTKQSKNFYVYILTNFNKTVLYTGVTSDLVQRVYQHKNNLADGFTKRYKVHDLVYYELYNDPENAITREKQIKADSRQKKIDLINSINKSWEDLYGKIAAD